MTRLTESLQSSGVFLNVLGGSHQALAIKDNSQVFVAHENIVRVTDIHGHGVCSVLNTQAHSYMVNQLVLNRNSSLLASVGDTNISIFDIKSKQHLKSGHPSQVLLASLPQTDSPIISAVWHPASGSNSELVILSNNKILVYDIVVSSQVPVFTVDLADYPEFEASATSIAFGSSVHFAGIITLYITNSNGTIYALYPFLKSGSQVWATKASAARYVSEWEATMEQIDEMVPESLEFQEARRHLDIQSGLVGSIRSQLDRPLCDKALDSQGFAWRPNFSGSCHLIGPLAYTGRGVRLIELCSNPKFSLVAAAFPAEGGHTSIQTLAQINPLVPTFTSAKHVNFPQLIAPSAPKHEDASYKKIKKGFGYEEISDDDMDRKIANYNSELRAYKEKLLAQNIEKAYFRYACENFNRLSLLTNDSVQFSWGKNIANPLKLIQNSVFVLSNDSRALIGDASPLMPKLEQNQQGNLEIQYKQKVLANEAGSPSDFAFIDDVIEGTGGYVVAISGKSVVSTVALNSEATRKKLLTNSANVQLKTKLKSAIAGDPEISVLPAQELRLLYPDRNTVARSNKAVVTEDYLKSSFDLTSTFLSNVGRYTQYLVAVQIKLGLQISHLKSQIQRSQNICQITEAENKEKISSLEERQRSLSARLDSVQSNIMAKFEASKSKQSLPLSDEEKKWFSELNVITKKVTLGDKDTPSLTSGVEIIKEQVKKVTMQSSPENEEESVEKSLARLRFGMELSDIFNSLHKEKSTIEMIKKNLSALESKIQDAY